MAFCWVAEDEKLAYSAIIDSRSLTAQSAMRKVVKGVGGFVHAKWRAFTNQYMPSGNSTGFVDGDLIEQFLDLR